MNSQALILAAREWVNATPSDPENDLKMEAALVLQGFTEAIECIETDPDVEFVEVTFESSIKLSIPLNQE